ncbi:MAG TPA: DUF92 domain-containing protein [Nitrososphaerales archaeon]|nr:DUF92 domain-containing protein [Nitrososphaerales archaeon]
MLISPLVLLAGLVFIIALAMLAIKARAIDTSGGLAGIAITFVTFVAGGPSWLVIVVVFFVGSSILTRFRYDYKVKLGSAQEKGGTRSWPNTVANGGVAALLAVAEVASHRDIFVIGFLTSVAAALADTVATEVGLLSRSKPRLITDIRRFVAAGTSGGVSSLGEGASIASAFVIVGLGGLLSIIGGSSGIPIVPAAVSIVVGAIAGTTFDSLLGATIEATRKCVVCAAYTQSAYHHDRETVLIKGSKYVDNNMVNVLGIIGGVVVGVLLYVLLR